MKVSSKTMLLVGLIVIGGLIIGEIIFGGLFSVERSLMVIIGVIVTGIYIEISQIHNTIRDQNSSPPEEAKPAPPQIPDQ